jgi:hypothetical protein
MAAVEETVEAVGQKWWDLPERADVPASILEPIDAHVTLMTQVLAPGFSPSA